MDLFREKHTPQTEYGSSQKVRLVLGYEVVSFKRVGSFMAKGGVFQLFRGRGLPGNGPLPTC